jgi:hypothetical protein
MDAMVGPCSCLEAMRSTEPEDKQSAGLGKRFVHRPKF